MFCESMAERISEAACAPNSRSSQGAGFPGGPEKNHNDTAAPASRTTAFGVTS